MPTTAALPPQLSQHCFWTKLVASMTWVEGSFCITIISQTTIIFASKLIPTQLTKPVNARKKLFLPCENLRFVRENWCLPWVSTYSKSTSVSIIVPARTLIAVKLLRISIFLIFLYVMDLATVVSIQVGPTHPTTSQKCRTCHFGVCTLQKRYNFFNLKTCYLNAKFPQPSSKQPQIL